MIDGFEQLQTWIFEHSVQPLAFQWGLGNVLEQAYEGTGWVLLGLLQVAVLLLVFGPLERWHPVEPVRDRHAVRIDIIYTLIHRLGLVKLVLFFSVDLWLDQWAGALRAQGVGTLHLDELLPAAWSAPWVSFVLYLLVFDLLQYAFHRAQHRFDWWWALHAVHHSQRQMTMWTDDRNHLLDDVLRNILFVGVALLIGVPPGQFVALVVVSQLCESFQHANVRIWFGRLGERLLISPRFHRMHHSVGFGHEDPRTQALGGCNFGVLFPWWDMLFGTANFALRFDATGIRDQVEQGRDYGRGFWAQQWLGLRRLFGAH